MGIKRIVDTGFWTDDKVMMEFSPEDRLFMLYLLTNPHTTQLGVYKILPKQMAFELGYSSDTINVLLDRFETKYNIVRYSKATSEIAVRNYLKYSIVKGGKPVLDLLTREAKQVKDKSLLAYINESASLSENTTVQEFCELFNEKENDNDNDNDNDDSSTNRQRFVNDSSKPVLPYEKIKEQILSNKGDGEKTCAWCGCKTTILHRHHYPIPKRMGGTETVDICSNCHGEFHLLEGQKNTKFVPPTLEEVTAYVAERKSKVIPQAFIDFYESKGWMVGKNKMKDWKAACRNAEGWDRWDKMPRKVGANGIPISNTKSDLEGVF